MRTYRNYNEDYELGYEEGKKDALRRLNESSCQGIKELDKAVENEEFDSPEIAKTLQKVYPRLRKFCQNYLDNVSIRPRSLQFEIKLPPGWLLLKINFDMDGYINGTSIIQYKWNHTSDFEKITSMVIFNSKIVTAYKRFDEILELFIKFNK